MCVYPNRSALCDYLGEKRTTLVVTVAGGAVAALLYLVPLATAAVPHQPCLQQAHTLSRIQYGRMHTHTDTHAHKHTLMNVRIHVCTHTHTHVCTHPKRTHCTHAPPERTHCTRATRSTHKCTLAHTSVQLWEALRHGASIADAFSFSSECSLMKSLMWCHTPSLFHTLPPAHTFSSTFMFSLLAFSLQHTHILSLTQHTATHCNALQHTATHCNTLQLTGTGGGFGHVVDFVRAVFLFFLLLSIYRNSRLHSHAFYGG